MSYLRTVTLSIRREKVLAKRVMLLNNARLTKIKLVNLSTGYFIFMDRKRTAESNLTSTSPSTRSMLQTLLTAHFGRQISSIKRKQNSRAYYERDGVNKGQSKFTNNNPINSPTFC